MGFVDSARCLSAGGQYFADMFTHMHQLLCRASATRLTVWCVRNRLYRPGLPCTGFSTFSACMIEIHRSSAASVRFVSRESACILIGRRCSYSSSSDMTKVSRSCNTSCTSGEELTREIPLVLYRLCG